MRVAVFTVSDSAAQGTRPDRSGPALAERCRKLGWEVVSAEIVSDDRARSRNRLARLGDSGCARSDSHDRRHRGGAARFHARSHDSSLRETRAGDRRSDAGKRPAGESARRAVARRGGRESASPHREYAGKPTRRRGIARRCGRDPAARGRSAAGRAPRLKRAIRAANLTTLASSDR